MDEDLISDPELDIDNEDVDESRPDEGMEEESLYLHKRFKADLGQKIMRLDQWLFSLMRNKSRTQIKNAALAGCIRVNGKVIKPSYKVKPGDEVTLVLPHPPPPQLGPEDIPVDIQYEDDDFLMVNKSPNLVVHPGVGNWTGTMLHGLLFHLNKGRFSAPRAEWIFPQLVHRIDKDTSGLLVVPKHDFANQFIARQFYERTIERLYYAIVWGNVEQDSGTIIGHVGRSKGDRKKFCVYPDGSVGKRAITHYKVLERFGFATLLQCKLETGRTHQIRVHLKHIGHTLFSDWFYGGDQVLIHQTTPKWGAFISNLMETLPRQALHAKTLGFIHPQTRKKVFFESELPEDFLQALEKMRVYRDAYMNPTL
ncbi:MAG: hypothetical protein RLZZ165_2256 [Bacteroidota bacterium]